MSIGKIRLGDSFAGVLRYLEGKKDGQLLFNNTAGETWKERAQDMDALARGSQRCEKPVFHVSMSAPPGEHPTDKQWLRAASTYLREMGFDSSYQVVIVKHNDKNHAHIHVVVNRVGPDGRAVNMQNNYERSMAAMRIAEREAGLQSFHEYQAQKGKGSEKGRMAEIRASIDRSLDGKPGLDLFKSRMQREGFDVIENRSPTTGRLSGLSFQSLEDGKTWKGSEIGKGYSASGLKKCGLDLDGDREHALLKRDKLKSLMPSRQSNRLLGKMGAPRIPLPTPLRALAKVAKSITHQL